MTSPKQQKKNEKKLEDDPYFIASVPMYCVLGQELDDTIGDLFFDLNPKNFQLSSPPELHKAKEKIARKDTANIVKDRAAKKIIIGDPANMTTKLKPRQSRSLIKPGRPSVAKKLAAAEAEVEMTADSLKDIKESEKNNANFGSFSEFNQASNTKSLDSVKPVTNDPHKTRKAGIPIMQKWANAPLSRLRSGIEKDEVRTPNQKRLVTPVKQIIPNNSCMQLRSSAKKQAHVTEIKQVEKQAVSKNNLLRNIAQPTVARSRSLVKSERPSVADNTASAVALPPHIVSVDRNLRVSPEVKIVAEVFNKPSLVVNPRKNKSYVVRDVFSTKNATMPPSIKPIEARLRTLKASQKPSSNPLNASGNSSVRSKTPAHRSTVSNYMTPTLSSSRRTTGVSLPKNK